MLNLGKVISCNHQLLHILNIQPDHFVGFDLTTHDSNFTCLVEVFLNHILTEIAYFTNYREGAEHKTIKVLKRANKYQIIW